MSDALSMHVRGVEGEDLYINKLDGGEVSFTVLEQVKGAMYRQIDFRTLSSGEVRDLIKYLESALGETAHKKGMISHGQTN